ncbi:hypothetical protein FVR03_09785 [Pontibacter qinzhouensis]|uniref:Uncharacterized protein n=1 Tax=Pontibacter qinzhouensis TaxID=2603253 RepID=A0A5C8KBK8_9BACT|nr:hypothetical protein [Pontibacter qinzhouensis]TXK47128.1 hypothetical protein FVR03_09785 [Pontibacter qinzhouensis]
MQQKLQEIFEPIVGLPLTRTTRNGKIQYFHFGSTHYTTSQGLVLDIGAYTLALDCAWHLDLPKGDAISHKHVLLPRQTAGLPDPAFDWKVPGANLRDQRLKDLLKGGYPMNADIITSGQDAGFQLDFTNGAILKVAPSAADKGEFFWQLFSNLGDDFKATAGPSGIIS